MMIGTLNDAIAQYQAEWAALIAKRTNRRFFEELCLTAIAWKTADRAEYSRILVELHDLCDIVVENNWDDRWIAMLHLKDITLANGIEIIKLMQRRPGSTDSVGLDHIDFYSSRVAQADQILKEETGLHWTHETGGPCKWISLWFADTEAKLRTHTVVDSCIRDLNSSNDRIKTKQQRPD
jgi:hypothetical protein